MRSILSFFVVVATLATAIPAEAQQSPLVTLMAERIINSSSGIYGGGYYGPRLGRNYGGYYQIELAMVVDFLKMPGVLNACTLSTSVSNPEKQVAMNCHIIMRSSPESVQAQLGNFPESDLLGTQHPEAGVMHIRAYDPTHKPFNRNHKDCIPVESRAIQPAPMPTAEVATPLPTPQTVPVKRIDPEEEMSWNTVNTTDFTAVVVDPNTGRKELISAMSSASLSTPTGSKPYVVTLLVPGRGNIDKVPGEIRPSKDLQGWEIVAR
ncbi:MAG: hypothetical protein A3B91_00520 [Candidatus Yanofskybacteria bacterium RIFCSPHIGHO2_02_FULL_41_29]|uniref:Uncharacterized protein n=1 Tax=Candidatus Yanofskybacteria bacterium RIFCSPHIGHO2_01_FULL_41_53 TaxID=1802663 RepID=A0A1F8ELN4_9BACT|nr:MAG: hypothetical protein A2650_03305 [Candidatus Yanofskybacteria bacterium RIFCSPHIGHO2_01_FULL_41_53]OGN12156.1 MAG: hypothetical protein A3B91_00520 [Candidatus Yanofskybacteria bacterium RIFCSPHIGHO2_02_FULL_41_29]OGN17956.1 MAG: hypothetical protein A3F48_04610 [Candidatus Yanofskybacteria bacterium RIFCSPHIGHO2_12_FULL_41_9]OGN23657.1 MAG: hypothetical protein A2916_03615 [Candidatus Yanofskybacteria bacterium RIFCSPLOWO2_01_FULL_41_67]OGN29215.1 MAG: hypothetical protein A3H54_03500 